MENSQGGPSSQRGLIVGYIVPDNIATNEDIVKAFVQIHLGKVALMAISWKFVMMTLSCSGRGGG